MEKDKPLFLGKEIYALIPQRPPIVMVDRLWEASESDASTELLVEQENIFVQDGIFQSPGVMEHIAQSAAVFAGYPAFLRQEPPKLGYIGEIKKCKIYGLPAVGEVLSTKLSLLADAGSLRLISASVKCGERQIAECQMKIFLKED